MSRDFLYPHEEMPTNTDREFVAMVRQAERDGIYRSDWQRRLTEIAHAALAANEETK